MPDTQIDEEFQAVIQHLASKAVAKVKAGEAKIQMRVSAERHQKYGGQLQLRLWDALNAAGLHCAVRQWTGEGHTSVLEVTVEQKRHGDVIDYAVDRLEADSGAVEELETGEVVITLNGAGFKYNPGCASASRDATKRRRTRSR